MTIYRRHNESRRELAWVLHLGFGLWGHVALRPAQVEAMLNGPPYPVSFTVVCQHAPRALRLWRSGQAVIFAGRAHAAPLLATAINAYRIRRDAQLSMALARAALAVLVGRESEPIHLPVGLARLKVGPGNTSTRCFTKCSAATNTAACHPPSRKTGVARASTSIIGSGPARRGGLKTNYTRCAGRTKHN